FLFLPSSIRLPYTTLFRSAELGAVMGPYVTLGFVLLGIWLLIAFTKMPKASTETTQINLWPTIKRLVKKKNYALGVITQFFYVGAQICVWSFTIRYVMAELGVVEADASSYYIAALIVFTAFRFINTFLMKYIRPSSLLMGAAMLGVLATFI